MGWAAGFVFWFGVCSWIQFVLEVHGGMGRWGGWGTFALFAVLKGLHTGDVRRAGGIPDDESLGDSRAAALWTGVERTHRPVSAFAWLDLGNAGIDMPLPMRLAPITGVYGLSFVFAMIGLRGGAVVPARATARTCMAAGAATALDSARRARARTPEINARWWCSPTSTPKWSGPRIPWPRSSAIWRCFPMSRASHLIVWPEAPAPFYPKDFSFHGYVCAHRARPSSRIF